MSNRYSYEAGNSSLPMTLLRHIPKASLHLRAVATRPLGLQTTRIPKQLQTHRVGNRSHPSLPPSASRQDHFPPTPSLGEGILPNATQLHLSCGSLPPESAHDATHISFLAGFSHSVTTETVSAPVGNGFALWSEQARQGHRNRK